MPKDKNSEFCQLSSILLRLFKNLIFILIKNLTLKADMKKNFILLIITSQILFGPFNLFAQSNELAVPLASSEEIGDQEEKYMHGLRINRMKRQALELENLKNEQKLIEARILQFGPAEKNISDLAS